MNEARNQHVANQLGAIRHDYEYPIPPGTMVRHYPPLTDATTAADASPRETGPDGATDAPEANEV